MKPDKSPKRPPLLDLIESLGRLAASDRRQHAVAAGLLPMHLQTLDYLYRSNRYGNTPQALAEYLGLTKGTVSQSLQLLERKGLIARLIDADDRRVVRLALTAAGSALVRDAASGDEWRAALAALPADEVDAAGATLTRLLTRLQQQNGRQGFGTCHTCRHFRREPDGRYRCGLTGEPLSSDDSQRICREHEWPESGLAAGPRGKRG